FSNGSPSNDTSDFRGLALTDVYGSSLNTAYQSVTLNAAGWVDLGNRGNGLNAATNAADDAAKRIRNGTTSTASVTGVASGGPDAGLSGVIIHSIGLGNAAVPLPADGIFLNRVSNTPQSQTYDSSKGSGVFVYAPTAAELGSAFQKIASEILRIA